MRQVSAQKPHLSRLAAWALAFGCALGWDSFVLPWTSFLPKAGPLGTVLGLLAGGFVMGVIAWNYHFMVSRRPGPGGVYAYATEAFGVDHGFLCAWFLCIVYVSITWMDAAVLAYFVQHAWRIGLQFGFHYVVSGYEVGLGHILLSSAGIAIAALICCRRRLSAWVQTALALVFAAGVLACFAAALLRHEGGLRTMAPAFAPGGGRPLMQVFGIVALSPWLFIGFESISHSSGEFRFPRRRTFGVMAAALLTSVAAYVLLAFIPTLVPWIPSDGQFTTWPDAVAHIAKPNDAAFSTAGRAFAIGRWGLVITTATFFAAIFTNLIGNTVAASRLLAAMADDGCLPAWFGRKNGDGAPGNAILASACVSVFIFALGETVIGIVVDLALVGAALAYAYTSAATFRLAREAGRRLARFTGFFGLILSVAIILLFLLPNFSSHTATMATESYLVLIVWCIVGLLVFLSVFRRDSSRRFGKSPVVWLALFATILFLSVLWVRKTTHDTTEAAFGDIVRLHDDMCQDLSASDIHWHGTASLRESLRVEQTYVNGSIMSHSFVQTFITILSLALMLGLFNIHRRRERELEREKVAAKSYFFSTVSHDIRTPLNAIIGFSEVLKKGSLSALERDKAIDSIVISGKTLLALINDVLDLSKLESGKMEIVPEPTDCHHLMRGVMDAFRIAGGKSDIELRCRVEPMPLLMLDPQRLRQIVFNLVGNAVKFTTKGFVELRACYERAAGSDSGTFRLAVEDTGCGIGEEDLKRIATAYVQVGSRNARNGGTGLGLAICRQLAAAMGGGLGVASVLGKGSTFSITIPGVEIAPDDHPAQAAPEGAEGRPSAMQDAPAARPRRLLLVDDKKVNLLVLQAMLKDMGRFEIVLAMDGQEALQALRAPGAAPFDLVLTDLWMPNLDGEGLVRAIRADPALASLRVVVVTADVELRGKAADMGFDDILLKPVTTESLDRLLNEIPTP